MLAACDRVSGRCNPLRFVQLEEPELRVHARRGGLDPAEPACDGSGNRLARDPEVLDRLVRLVPPELASLGGLAHDVESSPV